MEVKLLFILNFNGFSSNLELVFCKVLYWRDFIVLLMYVVKRNNKMVINCFYNNILFYNINFGLYKL